MTEKSDTAIQRSVWLKCLIVALPAAVLAILADATTGHLSFSPFFYHFNEVEIAGWIVFTWTPGTLTAGGIMTIAFLLWWYDAYP